MPWERGCLSVSVEGGSLMRRHLGRVKYVDMAVWGAGVWAEGPASAKALR